MHKLAPRICKSVRNTKIMESGAQIARHLWKTISNQNQKTSAMCQLVLPQLSPVKPWILWPKIKWKQFWIPLMEWTKSWKRSWLCWLWPTFAMVSYWSQALCFVTHWTEVAKWSTVLMPGEKVQQFWTQVWSQSSCQQIQFALRWAQMLPPKLPK